KAWWIRHLAGSALPPENRRRHPALRLASIYNLAMSETAALKNSASETPFPRRAFLRGATAMTALSYSRVYGANDRIQLGLIGCGERGRGDMGKFVKAGNVDVAAVC